MANQDTLFLHTFQSFLEQLQGANELTDLKACINEPKNHLALLQWRMRSLLNKHPSVELKASATSILTSAELLELLLTSGDVLDEKWGEVLNILASLIDIEPQITLPEGSLYLKRLAVAIALTFSTPVKSFASYDAKNIDGVQRFVHFKAWCEADRFFPVHETLSAWLLRYVVASWAEDEELEWARANILPEFKRPDAVGEATHAMVSYHEFNHAGISIHDGAPYYDHKPVTLALLHEYGAVCGGVSKFGTGIAQAFGIPACPIGQPGHCAFLWWREGEWVMSNGNSAITESRAHDGIQWTWNKRCDYQLLLDKAQKMYDGYVRSEQHRWVSTLVSNVMMRLKVLNHASELCPANYVVWRDLITLSHQISAAESVESKETPEIPRQFFLNSNRQDLISSGASVSASVEDSMGNLIDGTGSEWYSRDAECWIELDLHQCYRISRIEIQWWGISVSKHYEVQAASEDGIFTTVKTQGDEYESPQDYNEWSKLLGWTKSTRKVKFLLRDGQLDPWGMNVWIGVRQIKIFGSEVSSDSGQSQHSIDLPGDLFPANLEESLERWLGECQRQMNSEATAVLSRFGVVTSSVPDRAENVIDGTGSEWYCENEEGWLIVDLGSLCKVTDIHIQWWGISASKNYQILVGVDEGDEFVVVASNEDEYESPSGDYNEWSKCHGWERPTRRVKIDMRDGALDPWGHSVWIGVRQLNIFGRDISCSGDERLTLKDYLGRGIRECFVDFPKIGRELLASL